MLQIKNHFKQVVFSLKEHKDMVMAAIIMSIITDSVFVQVKSDVIILSVIAIYILAIRTYSMKARTTFLVCFMLLALFFLLFLFTGTSKYTEKASAWLFLFMATGIIQEFVQRNNETA